MANSPGGAGAGTVAAAVLLPPLGVFLHQGITPNFWIAVGLTCLGFVPGAVFAVLTVLCPRLLHAR